MYGRLIHGELGDFLHDAFPILILVFGLLACAAYAMPNRRGGRRFRLVMGVLLLVSGVATAALAMMASAEEEPFAVQWALLAVFAALAAIAVRPVGDAAALGRAGGSAYAEQVPGPVQPPQHPPPSAPGQTWTGDQTAQPAWQQPAQLGQPAQSGQSAASAPSIQSTSERTQQLPQQPLRPPQPPQPPQPPPR